MKRIAWIFGLVSACSSSDRLRTVQLEGVPSDSHSAPINDAEENAISYRDNPVTYALGETIVPNVPTATRNDFRDYSTTPVLPMGLAINADTGVISGTATEASAMTAYSVRASSPAGVIVVTVSIAVTGTDAIPADAPPPAQCSGVCFASPTGWTGPVVLYDDATTAPACDGAYATELAVGKRGLSWQDAQCSCGCSTTCLFNFDYYSDGACSTQKLGTGDAYFNPSVCGSNFFPGYAGLVISQPMPYCWDSPGASTGPVSAQGEGRVCAQSSAPSGECGAGESCATPRGKLCLYQASNAPDGLVCPSGYAEKHVYTTHTTDTRACTGCSGCSTPGVVCEASHLSLYYDDTQCSTSPVTMSSGNCYDTSTISAMTYVENLGTNLCTPGTSAAQGTVTADEGFAVCCPG